MSAGASSVGPVQPAPFPMSSGPPSWTADRRPGAALAAGVLGVVGALPLAFLVPLLSRPGGDGPLDGGMWVLLVAFPLVQAGGGVLLLRRRSWRTLALSCGPGIALMALLFLVSGPDLPVLLLSLVQLVVSVVTVCLTLHRDVRDWVAERPSRPAGHPPGGRRGPAASG